MHPIYSSDVVSCARSIVRDLRPPHWPAEPRWHDLCDLAEKHGGAPLIDAGLDRARRGKCHDGEIILSPALTLDEYREVIPHEITHRLADTDRWANLNAYIAGNRYHRHEFVEQVARLVGKMFAGGM